MCLMVGWEERNFSSLLRVGVVCASVRRAFHDSGVRVIRVATETTRSSGVLLSSSVLGVDLSTKTDIPARWF